jgi:hypothetical protein
MKRWPAGFALGLSVLLTGAGAQPAAAQRPAAPTAAGASAAEPPTQHVIRQEVAEGLRAADFATKSQVVAVQTSVAEVSKAVKDLSSKGPDLTAPLFALFGVLAGGFINFWATRKIAQSKERTDIQLADNRQAADLAIATARQKLDVAKSIIDWQLRQLAELYGPLRTMFAQSNAIYRTMNRVLEDAKPEKFKLAEREQLGQGELSHLKVEDADEDGLLFLVRLQPQTRWERFRTVMYIDEVYGQGYQVELYFSRIVDISVDIVKTISEKAGLALGDEASEVGGVGGRDDQVKLKNTLRHKFGEYLAHAAVLKAVHENRRSRYLKSIGETQEEPPALVLKVHKSAAFPNEIQQLVGRAYMQLQASVSSWADRAK